MTRSCPSCGATLPEAATRFCLSCGYRLTPAQPAADPPPRAAPAPQPPAYPSKDPGTSWYPGDDSRPDSGHEGKGRGGRAGIITIVILVILAGAGVGAYALIRHGHHHQPASAADHGQPAANSATTVPVSSSPVASASEQQQLSRFLVVVQGSASARDLVKTAVPQVGACSMSPADGASQLQQAISERQRLLTTLTGLQVSAIPSGEPMRADLTDVLQLSIAADRDFIQWMQDPQSTQNCPSTTASDTAYAAGLQISKRAQQAKTGFLALWNPMAQQFGQPTFSTVDI
jgi:hypothetical protein